MASSESNDGQIFEESQIQKFYENTVVFITGASGFIGRLILEKLLRNCSNISKIYLLLRSKKNKTMEERMDEIFNDVVFERVRNLDKNLFKKVVFMNGDCSLPNLGLSENDQQKLIDEVNIVFHGAAIVKFDELMSKAISSNVRATRDLLQIAVKMQNLKSFLYMSTAYSFCHQNDIDEHVYDTHISGEKMIKIIEVLDDDQLLALQPLLLGKFPNTYVFSKALAENYVKEMSKLIPVSIIRPSIVCSTLVEPVPGWINNFYGFVGIIAASTVGLLRVLRSNKHCKLDIIPGDHVSNASIVVATNMFKKKNTIMNGATEQNDQKYPSDSEVQVYNCVSSVENALRVENVNPLMYKAGSKFASLICMWYPVTYHIENAFLWELLKILLHTVPAYIIDGIAIIIGKKPRLVEGYKKLDKFLKPTSYFTLREWNFSNKNLKNMWYNLNEKDKELFPFDINVLNWEEYIHIFAKGGRVYLLKDPLETLPEAKKRAYKLCYAHYTLVSILTLIFSYFLFMLFQLIFKLF